MMKILMLSLLSLMMISCESPADTAETVIGGGGRGPGGGGSSLNIPKKIFVTPGHNEYGNGNNDQHQGNFGGVAGADQYCLNSPNHPNDGAVYKALIVDGVSRRACSSPLCSGGNAEHIDWVLIPNTTYIMAQTSAEIGRTNDFAIFDAMLSQPVLPAFIYTYTGISNDWTTGNTCSNWSSSSGVQFGVYGVADQTDMNFVADGETSCSDYLSIYCVEQ
jgi:hypothetical protein